MIHSCKGIEIMVNLVNIAYCAIKLLPYQDGAFAKYHTVSVQEFRFVLSGQSRKQVFYTTFVDNIENTIKSTAIMNTLKQLIAQQGFHL